jgi:hypothetical protein
MPRISSYRASFLASSRGAASRDGGGGGVGRVREGAPRGRVAITFDSVICIRARPSSGSYLGNKRMSGRKWCGDPWKSICYGM